MKADINIRGIFIRNARQGLQNHKSKSAKTFIFQRYYSDRALSKLDVTVSVS